MKITQHQIEFSCKNVAAVPSTRHWVIITTKDVVYYDIYADRGDRETEVNYNVFTDRKEWVERIGKLTLDKIEFRAFEAEPISVSVNVDVVINKGTPT